MPILLNENHTTGTATWWQQDDDDSGVFGHQQDCTEIVEDCREERLTTAGERYGDMRKVGVLPAVVVGQAMREGWFHDPKRVRQWLMEHPDFLTFERGF